MAPRTFGYSADLEQRDPRELLDILPEVEDSGFSRVWTSDHFHPWFHRGAGTGFAWSWIPEALRATDRIPIGTGVTSTAGRYHPGIVAQASAYLSRIFPGRFFLGLGTGEAMNEEPLGFPWADYGERASRLSESIRIIRRLWESDFVGFRGSHFRLNGANIYSKPDPLPEIFVAANGPRSAALAGRYADGMITFEAEDSYYREVLFPALERGRAKVRGKKPVIKAVQLVVSYDRNRKRALGACRRWAGALTNGAIGIRDPRKLDELGGRVDDQTLERSFVVCSSAEEMASRLGRYFDLGFDHIVLLDSSPDPRGVLRLMKDRAVSQLLAK